MRLIPVIAIVAFALPTIPFSRAGQGQTVPDARRPRSAATTAAPTTNPVKSLLADEQSQLEREVATRMLRRADLAIDRRPRLELEIDLRILERGMIANAANAKFESAEQANAWLRAKQMRDAVKSFEDALAQDTSHPSTSQQQAIGDLHKLSFTPVVASDEFCRSAALAFINAVNASPVTAAALVPLRPHPVAGEASAADKPPTIAELTEQVQRLAALSIPLRQQLLALAAAAAKEKDDKSLHALLQQSVELARGLQSNTAVNPESRTMIESQLAEGIVLYTDPRTREAGKSRIDNLSQYRQTVTRIDKLKLSGQQMDQLAPAFAWAQANPDSGQRLLADIEQFFDTTARFDALPTSPGAVPATLKRAAEDARAQFGKARSAFMTAAAHLSPATTTTFEIDQTLDEVKRLYNVADDLMAMGPSLDTLNGLKIRPVGALEKRVTTAAYVAVAPALSPNRNDGQKYLNSVHTLANLAHALAARPLSELPSNVVQGWAGGRVEPFENRWKAVIVELAGSLIAGSIDLDAGKVVRLHTAQALGDGLRTAAQLEAALPRTPALARWADWSIEPATLQAVLSPYRDATAAALFGYAADNLDAVEKWQRLTGRYQPLIALILRDTANYADACQNFPIGLAAEVSRLATPFENAPFATERFASYAINVWALFERIGDYEQADHISLTLAKRLARDLRLDLKIDESPIGAKKSKP